MKLRATIRPIAAAAVLLAGAAARAAVNFGGVEALARRLGGAALADRLVFAEWPGETAEKARIVPGDGFFTIKATGVHLAAVALGVYLRDVAEGHVSWCGRRLPAEWPIPSAPIDVATRYPCAMAYNYCTLSYTMAYWGKEAWQDEIDRLALSGYGQALVMAGVQKVWRLTLEQMGYTERQREDFIVDDAAQAWWLMGNLQAAGDGTEAGRYPVVTGEQIETDAEIGRFIVRQMRAVGIEPVLQGFVGLVPSSTTAPQLAAALGYDLAGITGDATADASKVRIFRTGSYVANQKSPDLLDPTCDAFKRFSRRWNANLATVYGLDGETGRPKFLAGDLFHESAPPGSMTERQKIDCARFVQQYQQDDFPGVVWVLQSWQGSPDQSLRNGLDPARTIIQYLDQTMGSSAARTARFRNEKDGADLPYVWAEVMNFGGNTGMHGAFARFRSVGELGKGSDDFRGYGMLSEGLETNPASYDMYNSRFTVLGRDAQNIDDGELETWLAAYRRRRYGRVGGRAGEHLKSAQAICARTVWNCTRDQQGAVESVFCANPGYGVANVSAWGPATGTPYDRAELVEAARHFLAAAKAEPALLGLETFRYDFVEIFQQILADRAREILPECAGSRPRRDSFRRMLGLLDDILACSDEWRLDRKEARVTPKAGAAARAAYRRMITTWTPGARGQTVLSQYAHRSYAGLVKHYYAVKWNAFFDLADGLTTPAAYRALCRRLDRCFPSAALAASPVDGDPVAIAEAILTEIGPRSFAWTGAAGDGVFENANWRRDGQAGACAWEDGGDATVAADDLAIAVRRPVSIGDLTVIPAATVKATATGYIPPDTTVATGWTGLTLEELASSCRIVGAMAGGWVAEGEAIGRVPAFNADGSELVVQMQRMDGGFLKAVALVFSVVDGEIRVRAAWARNRSDKSPGADLSASRNSNGNPVVAVSDRDRGYGIKSLALKRGRLAFSGGPCAIAGTLRAPCCSLDFSGGADIAMLQLDAGETLTLRLPASGELAVAAAALGAGARLTLAGEWSGDTKVRLPRGLLAATVHVDDAGVARACVLDADGRVRTQPAGRVYDAGYATAAGAATGWTDITLAELASCEFTAMMNGGGVQDGPVAARGYRIALASDALEVQLQAANGGYVKSVPLVFTADGNGQIRVRAGAPGRRADSRPGASIRGGVALAASTKDDGCGIESFAVRPAAVRTPATRSNYASLFDAVAAAKGASLAETGTVEIFGDVAADAFGPDLYPARLEIAANGRLAAPATDDFLAWNRSWSLDIRGTLDLGDHSLSFGPSHGQRLVFRPGSRVVFASGRGISVFEAATLEFPGAADDPRPATIDAAIQVRKTTTVEVAAGATAIVNGDLLGKGAQGGDARAWFVKSGAGRLELNGAIESGAVAVRAAAGTLARALRPGETFRLATDPGATADITSADADCKIEISRDGDVRVFAAVPKTYLFRVTAPGNVSVNQSGTNHESFAEAVAAAAALQAAHPGREVKIWIVSAGVIDAAMAEVEACNAANGASITRFGDGNGNEIRGWRGLAGGDGRTIRKPARKPLK